MPFPFTVSVTNVTQQYDLILGNAYTVDWVLQTVTILNTLLVAPGDQLSISVYELGGGNQIYKNIYNGSQVGNSLIVPVPYLSIQEFVIFINGVYLDNSNYTYTSSSLTSTEVTFTNTYSSTDFISLVVIEPTTINNITTDYSWSLPLTQSFAVTSVGQVVFDLDPTYSLEYTNPVNAIVTVGGRIAIGPAGTPYVGDGLTTDYELPQRIGIDPILITSANVSVYVNGLLQNPSTYTLITLSGILYVSLTTAPVSGAQIYVSVNSTAQYLIDPVANTLTFNPAAGIVPTLGQIISVTTFNDTREQRLSTQIFVGPVTKGITVNEEFDTTGFDNPPGDPSNDPGQFDATVGKTISENDFILYQSYTDSDRPWISKNGKVLNPFIDFTITGNVLTLTSGTIQPLDVVMITNVTNSIVPEAMEFRIFQDMRGVQATYRMTPATTTTVTQTVSQYDDIVYVANASALSIPDFANNIWGVVTIDGERIMYREINVGNNTISSLLRGTAGTAAASHNVGAYVYDMGHGNLMSTNLQNYVISDNILADGTTTVFETGNISLEFTNAEIWNISDMYAAGTVVVNSGFYYRAIITVPSNIEINNISYWQSLSREVQVYIAGTLQTSGYEITNETPVTVTFETAPAQGVEITILVRRGLTWYSPGNETASNGVPLQETNTAAALFLRGIN
jgi:hypothetical protein